MGFYDDIFELDAVGGRYKLLRRLGSGAFGEVFLADQEAAGVPGLKFRQVAIKLFMQAYITSENAQKVFAEALLLERLAEDARSKGEPVHLVTTFDLGILLDLSATPFVAMECVHGSLEKELACAPALPLLTAARHLRGICAGLKLAHGHTPAILHRDLKPANILIEKSGFLKVADFGLAIDRYQAFLSSGNAGTISYAPPESRSSEPASPAFDVYSLGIMFLEMLAHCNPLERVLNELGTDPREIERTLDASQARLAELRDPLDGTPLTDRLIELRNAPGAQEIVRRCLAVDPARRFANAIELDAALASLEADRFIAPLREPVETGRERAARLLQEAEMLLKQDRLQEAEDRLAEVALLAPREERRYLALSRIREKQDRWREAVEAQKEANAIVAEGRRDRRADPVLIERLAFLYERSGKPLAAREVRRSLES
jgi:serine/threonine-protein kinase